MMQLQKTRNAETVTKTVIDQKQSLELVQTMLHGGVSCSSKTLRYVADTLDLQLSSLSYLR